MNPAFVIEDLAIVLQTKRFEDRHRIVTAITQHNGLLTTIARNSIHSRRFGSTLETFSASEWHLKRSQKNPQWLELTQATLKRSYDAISKDYLVFLTANALNDILMRTTRSGEETRGIFSLHANALEILSQAPKTQSDVFCIHLFCVYAIKLLNWHGLLPRLEHCQYCNVSFAEFPSSSSVAYYPQQGQWTCSNCRPKEVDAFSCEQIPVWQLSALMEALRNPLRQSCEQTAKLQQQTLKLILSHLHTHLPELSQKPLKSVSFFLEQSTAPHREMSPPQSLA